LLRQMGNPHIVARANDKLHHRILQLVGAHEIINPELEFGIRFANRLLYRDIIAENVVGTGESLQLTEIKIQPSMIGKNLIELALPKKFGIIVAGIRRAEIAKIVTPSPTSPLEEGDTLIVVSNESAIQSFVKGV